MKSVLFLIGIPLAGFLGYLLEPALRPSIMPAAKTAAPNPAPSTTGPSSDAAAPPSEPDLSSIPTSALPAEVSLLRDSYLTDPESGITLTIQSGKTVQLLGASGKTALVRPHNTTFTLSLPASHTDLARRLSSATPATPPVTASPATPEPSTPAPPATTPEPTEPAIASQNPVAGTPPADTPPESPATTTPATTAEPAAATTASTPDPSITSPDPTSTAPTTPSESAPALGPDQILGLMRQSLQNREIKEFSLGDVKSWKADPPETVEGVSYDVGSITYQQNSVFGLKSITAKAYIRNGKVDHWIWPKSGLVIR